MDMERILLTVFVIILHFNNRDMGGALNCMPAGPIQEVFIRMTESLAICAVDAFVILSGYFAVGDDGRLPASDTTRKQFKSAAAKSVWLLIACSFYRVTGYLAYTAFVTHDLNIRTLIGYLIPSNWYVCLFVTLLLISPFIIRAVSGLDDRTFDCFTGVLMLLFVAVPTLTRFAEDVEGVNLNGLSTVTFSGDALGFNIALFVAMYVMGMWIRRRASYWDRFGVVTYLISYLLFVILTAAISHFSESAWSYSCITVVLEAVSLTLMFTRIRFDRERPGRVISALAGCALGIFIWHTMPVMIFGFWSRFDIPGHTGTGGASMIGVFLAATLSMYMVSLCYVLVCRLVVERIKKH